MWPKLPMGKTMPRGCGMGRIDIPAKAAQVLTLDRRIVRSEQRICCVWCLCDGFSGGIVRCFELLSCMSGLLRSRHQLQSRLLQRKLARAARKPIKQGLRIDADIVRRREHTGMPGHSTHAARRRVMHSAPEQIIEIRDSCSDRLCSPRHVLSVRCATKDWCSMYLQDKRPARALLAREPRQSPLLSSCADHMLWLGEDSGCLSMPSGANTCLLNVNVF